MTQRSEQLVLDYLSEVGPMLHGRMTAKERTAYLLSVRSRIDERRAATGKDDVDTVRGILRGLGTPQDLVERELMGHDLDIEDDELIPPKPRHAERPPPPWRGGPSRGLISLLEGPGQTDMNIGDSRPNRSDRGGRGSGGLRGAAAVVRHHPSEAVALLLLLLTGPWWWNLAFLWVLGAVLILLSQVWAHRDKWIGVGLPLLACMVAMALWTGDAKFADQYIQESLPATGVIGLGLASVVCALYLYPGVLRSALSAEEAAGR